MLLYVMQHGEAYSKDEDPERPLTAGGRQTATDIGHWMHGGSVTVETILHSPKLRARETAEQIQAVYPDAGLESWAQLGPDGAVDGFVLDLASAPGNAILVVGHMPFVQRLTGRLLADDENEALVRFSPGAVICLERNGLDQIPLSYYAGGWKVRWMLSPELLA